MEGDFQSGLVCLTPFVLLLSCFCSQAKTCGEIEFLSAVSRFKYDVKQKVLKTPSQVLEALDGLRDQAETLQSEQICNEWRNWYRKFSTVRQTAKKSHAMKWARVTFSPHLAVSMEETEILAREVKRYSKVDSSSSSSSDSSDSDEESLKKQVAGKTAQAGVEVEVSIPEEAFLQERTQEENENLQKLWHGGSLANELHKTKKKPNSAEVRSVFV